LSLLSFQVWGELILEVRENELEGAKHPVKTEMEAVEKKLGLSVPLKVDFGVGKN
jgi:DNA polymerase I-like protein with 3'-5' exonuclease and polymerase domains